MNLRVGDFGAHRIVRPDPRHLDRRATLVGARCDQLAPVVEERAEQCVSLVDDKLRWRCLAVEILDRGDDRRTLYQRLKIIDEFEISQIGRYRVEIGRIFLDSFSCALD